MNISNIKGIIVPILTPVDKNENIDEDKLRKQVDFVISGGIHGILAYGSNGEFYMFNKDEMEKGLKIITEHTNERVPVFMGIGSISTKKCVEIAKMSLKYNIAGISILQPMFIKPNSEELYNHFKEIADSVNNIPVLLYNNPGRTGYTIPIDVIDRLAHDIDNLVGIKDSSGDITFLSELVRRTRDIDFKVLGGKDTLIYSSLCVGGVGSVCTTANIFPKLVTSIYEKYISGDLKGSLEDQFILNPVRLSMDKASFPVATKDMANISGLNVGLPIKPNLQSSNDVLKYMEDEMRKANLL